MALPFSWMQGAPIAVHERPVTGQDFQEGRVGPTSSEFSMGHCYPLSRFPRRDRKRAKGRQLDAPHRNRVLILILSVCHANTLISHLRSSSCSSIA